MQVSVETQYKVCVSTTPRMRAKLEDLYKRLDDSNEKLGNFRNNGLVDGYTAAILGSCNMQGSPPGSDLHKLTQLTKD